MAKTIALKSPGANMTIIIIGETSLYFSYETCVAVWNTNGKWRRTPTYSKTTAGHMTKLGVKSWPQVDDSTFEREAAVAS